MAESAVRSALENLSIFLLERSSSVNVVNEEIRSLIRDLLRINLKMKYAVARHDKNLRIHQLVKDVEDLAYRIEDATDIFVAGTDRLKRGIGKFIPIFAISTIYSFSREIKDIKRLMTDLIDDLETYSFLNVEENEKQFWLRKTHADWIEFDGFVGMGQDVDRLLSFIIDDDKHGQVVSICGMGGTGKTSLARILIKNEHVLLHFDCVAWVFISEKFVTRDIWKQILRQLQREKREEIDEVNDIELSYELYFALKEKKCLIVLDDIWSMDAWKSLSVIFPFGESASKIIITTRIREIAETVAEKRLIHQMRPLSEEESWVLFQNRAFLTYDRDFVVQPEMEMIGKEMAKRCGGIPLAIVVLGGIMSRKRTLMEWKLVHEDIEEYLYRGQRVGEAFHDVFMLSYDNLPYHLKPCFLYLGLFPADSDIEAEKLYLLWLAEGLTLSPKHGHEETDIDVAEQYLGELVLHSLVGVQEVEVPIIRRFKSCRLNKLMRDLCLFKGKEEKFLKVMDDGSENQQVSEFGSFSLSRGPRRVTLSKYVNRDVCYKYEMDKHLRCLLLLNVSRNEKESVVPVEIPNLAELNLLKILDFDGFDFRQTDVPRGMEKLGCLRYLSFKRCSLEKLPSSISKLSSLRILDLRVRSWITMRIPNVLNKLKNLSHLFLPQSLRTPNGKKLQMDCLTLLETLENFNTSVCNVGDLLKLTQLRYLGSTVEGNLEDLDGIIRRINMTSDHILHSSLDIRNFNCYTEERHSSFEQLLKCQALFILHIQGKLQELPPYELVSPCLMEIILDGAELEEDPMMRLENLPSLRVLVLRNDAFIGKKMLCAASGFSELNRLELSNLQFLEKWLLEGGAMPKLYTLTIEKCEMLDMVPNGLEFVTSLRDLKSIGMPQMFEDRLRVVGGKVGEDLHKVQQECHITFEK